MRLKRGRRQKWRYPLSRFIVQFSKNEGHRPKYRPISRKSEYEKQFDTKRLGTQKATTQKRRRYKKGAHTQHGANTKKGRNEKRVDTKKRTKQKRPRRKKGVNTKKTSIRKKPFFVSTPFSFRIWPILWPKLAIFCEFLREKALTGGSATFGADPFLNAKST